jgi:hypothetical protein
VKRRNAVGISIVTGMLLISFEIVLLTSFCASYARAAAVAGS